MTRIVIQHLLLFLLPTVMYAVYIGWARRRALAAGKAPPGWQEGPWFWLIVSGGGLVIASLVALALFSGAGPEAVYEPAILEGGKIVPGRVTE